MSTTLKNVLVDLKQQLEEVTSSLDWYYKRSKDFELKAINLKNTINEIEDTIQVYEATQLKKRGTKL